MSRLSDDQIVSPAADQNQDRNLAQPDLISAGPFVGHPDPGPPIIAGGSLPAVVSWLGGVIAMVQNIVAGLVVVALIFMGLLAWTQKHEECFQGHILKKLKPCGSVEHSI